MSDEGSNVINSTDAKRWVGEILASWKRTREIREEAKDKIRPELEELVEQRQGLYEAAENAGLPILALKLEVGRQKLDWENEIKKKDREAKAGTDTVDLADMIKEALGDFASSPLGGAAVDAAGASPRGKGKKGGKKPAEGGAAVDTSTASKADALGVGDDEDLRGDRQREREELRKIEAAERLKGIEPLDGQATAH